MENCRFCKIINGDRLEEEIIYEDDDYIILTDKYRKTSVGSICLLIPKSHKENILELSEKESLKLVPFLNSIYKAMQKAYNCKAIRIWTAVNKEAGQSIFHCHIHIVPCNSFKDRLTASFPGFYDYTNRILTFGNNKINKKLKFKLAEKLRTQINNSTNEYSK